MVSGCQKAPPLRSEVIKYWGCASKSSDLVSPFPELSGTGHFVDKEMANCSFSEKQGEVRHTYYTCWRGRFQTITTVTFKYRTFSSRKSYLETAAGLSDKGLGLKGCVLGTEVHTPCRPAEVLLRRVWSWVRSAWGGLAHSGWEITYQAWGLPPSTTAESTAKTWKAQSVEGRRCTLFW